MTKRERFKAFVKFEEVDRVPRYAHYTRPMREKMTAFLGKPPKDIFDSDDPGGANLDPPPGWEMPNYRPYFPEYTVGKDGFYIDENGCGHVPGGYFHFTEYVSPLRNATSFREIEEFPVCGNEGWTDGTLRKAGAEAHAAGNYAQVFVGHLYETAWQIRGYEQFLLDLVTQREWAESLLDRLMQNNIRVAVAAAKAGYDVISTGDDIANQNAMMFQPDLWREVLKSRWARIIAAARAIKPDIEVWYHSDGNIAEVVDDLIEIGITILNPIQPECVDPVKLRKRYGKNIAFDGCLGTQSVMPFGKPADVKAAVRSLVKDLKGRSGGLKLAPTHVLEPEVPCENVVAFYEACDE